MQMWEILNISATTNIKDIKRAYATQLKLTSPEENPEAFQLLRQAYEQALVSVENNWIQDDLGYEAQQQKASINDTYQLLTNNSKEVIVNKPEAMAYQAQEAQDQKSFKNTLWKEANEQASQLIEELNSVEDFQSAQTIIKQRLQNDWFIYVDAQLMLERCLVEQVAADLDVISTFGLSQIASYFNWEHPHHPLWQEDPFKLKGILVSLRCQYERIRMQTPKNYGLLAGFVRGIQKKPNFIKFHYLASTIERKAAIKEQMLVWLEECPEVLETNCNAESVKWWQEVIFHERPLLLGNTWLGAIRFALCMFSAIWVFSKLESIQPINPLLFFPILSVHWIALYQFRKFIYEKTQWRIWVKKREDQFADLLMQVDNWRVSDNGKYLLSSLMLSQLLLMAVNINFANLLAVQCYILLLFWWGWNEFRRNAFLALTYPGLAQLQLSPEILNNGFFLHIVGCWVVFSLYRIVPSKMMTLANGGFFIFLMWAIPVMIIVMFKL